MVKVGVHVSIAGSLDLAVDRAFDAGCDVFQMFTRNPRGWAYPPLNDDVVDSFRTNKGLHVLHIAVYRILGAGTSPENALRSRLASGKFLKTITREDFLVDLVGDFGTGDSHLAKTSLGIFSSV